MKIFEKKQTGRRDVPSDHSPKEDEKGGKKVFFEEDLVRMVEEKAQKRKAERLPFELQWRLNTNFLLGNQYCDINVHRMSVENYEPLYDYMSREVFNRIAPIMETRLSHLQTVNYDMAVLPKTDEYEDLQKAKISTALLSGKQKTEEYQSAFFRAMGLCEQTGNAFFLSWWDKTKGKGGDLAFTVLTPYEVLPENLCDETVSGQPSVIIEQIKSASEVRELYGVEVKGGKTDGYRLLQTAGAGGLGYESATFSFAPCEREDTVILRTYMEKPSAGFPDGRLILTAGGKLLFYGALPYDGYPLCQIKSERVVGQFFGKSVIETLIPYQRSYNGIKNRINDFVNRSTCGQLLIEEGSVDADDLTEKGLVPGEPVFYQRGSELPKLLEEPQLSDLAMAQCDQLAQDMEYAAGVSGLMTGGTLPGGVTSGSAIDKLQNIDTTRLSIYADNIRDGVLRLARIWLSIYRKYLSGKRMLKLTGENERGATVFCTQSDLNSDELVFETENELKTRAETQRERYIEAIRLGLFSGEDGRLSKQAREQAARRLLGKQELRFSASELQRKNACGENAAFERGEPLCIMPLDDDELHLEEHRLYALQQRFRSLFRSDPGRCVHFTEHMTAHEERLKEKKREEENNER